jgi:hypothetical protein
MSRRNNVTEPAYGQIKMECPRGHEAGVILVQPRRPIGGLKTLYRLGSVLKAPEIAERPGGKLESAEENIVHEGRMEWGRTVEAECRICGRPYWTLWETVEPEIAKTADTPVVTLTLDDDPLC